MYETCLIIIHVGSKLWDALSVSDVELPDIYTFKFRLKRLNRMHVYFFYVYLCVFICLKYCKNT